MVQQAIDREAMKKQNAASIASLSNLGNVVLVLGIIGTAVLLYQAAQFSELTMQLVLSANALGSLIATFIIRAILHGIAQILRNFSMDGGN